MKTYKTRDLNNILKRKCISKERKSSSIFEKYSYYQLMNAYKSLFIEEVYNVQGIKRKIESGDAVAIEYFEKAYNVKSSEESNLVLAITKKILMKYSVDSTDVVNDNIKKIEKINYIHHKYDESANVEDFVRIYKFEHELRSVLLRYILIVEEKIKNIFCNTLNDSQLPHNCLLDLHQYDLIGKPGAVVNSVKKIFDKMSNPYSKAMQRKREQEIIPPFWMIIHSLTMNETLIVIKNLKSELSEKIYHNIIKSFTDNPQNITDDDIKAFKNIIFDLGSFRNTLAHNSPVFCYNVDDDSLINYPDITYMTPKKKGNEKKNSPAFQGRKRAAIESTKKFYRNAYGLDFYNDGQSCFNNYNLSYIIYSIYKIMTSIDKNAKISNEIKQCYIKYNLINNLIRKVSIEEKKLVDLMDIIKGSSKELEQVRVSEIRSLVESGVSYKQSIRNKEARINKIARDLIRAVKELEFEKLYDDYDNFRFKKNYKKYTSIDYTFLTNI